MDLRWHILYSSYVVKTYFEPLLPSLIASIDIANIVGQYRRVIEPEP
jgi:hypothetical protein